MQLCTSKVYLQLGGSQLGDLQPGIGRLWCPEGCWPAGSTDMCVTPCIPCKYGLQEAAGDLAAKCTLFRQPEAARYSNAEAQRLFVH